MKKLISLFLFAILTMFFVINVPKAINGIDVSLWQGKIDFSRVKESGIEIVYIRSSAGNSYVDGDFEKNYREAKAAGLKVGVYHYVTARTIEEGRKQAQFFASVIKEKEIDCRLAMDFEVFTGLTRKEVNEISRIFLKTLEDLTKKELVIYSDAYNARRVFDKSLFRDYPLWVAEYDVERPSADNYIGWQYTDRGRVDGIRGNVDRDIFYEDIYLTDNTPIKNPEIDKDDHKKIVYYRVHKNDTLSHIAKKYHTSLNKIINDNHLKNPNLIFPNQVIKLEIDFDYQVTDSGILSTYTVKWQDNLTKIARKYQNLVLNLVTWNNIINPNLIYPGQVLITKPQNNDHLIKYIIRENDTLKMIADDYKVSLLELCVINKIMLPYKIKVNDIIYIPENYILEK